MLFQRLDLTLIMAIFLASLTQWDFIEGHRFRRTTTTPQSSTTEPVPQRCSADRFYPRGTVMEVKCPDGYQLLGAASANCDENGTWSGGPMGFCQKSMFYHDK